MVWQPCAHTVRSLFSGYGLSEAFDEMFDGKAQPRRHYRKLHKELLKLTPEELLRSKQQADLTFFNQGITFTVYGRNEATERIFPHDAAAHRLGRRLGSSSAA